MPDPTTQRVLVLAAILARLQVIHAGDAAPEGNGTFITDVGESIHIGVEPKLSKDDPDALVVVVLDDDLATPGQQLKVLSDLPIEFQTLAAADLDDPWLTVEALLGDTKRAFELEDRTLGGLVRSIRRGPTRTLPREPGSTTVGAGITYIFGMTETWGRP